MEPLEPIPIPWADDLDLVIVKPHYLCLNTAPNPKSTPAMRVQLKLQSASRHAGISLWNSDVPGRPRLR
jgi:phosphorylcholine metabolism protein LicD